VAKRGHNGRNILAGLDELKVFHQS
jgi:hypothetical protein